MPDEFSADEATMLAFAVLATALAGWLWYAPIFRVRLMSGVGDALSCLALLPLICHVLLLLVLHHWAAHDVRESNAYQFLFLAVQGFTWLAVIASSSFLGISLRDDAVERRNPAASIVLFSALLAATLCYAGGNIGEGSTIGTTILPAALAVSTLLVMWFIAELITKVSVAITVERHTGSALRLSGALLASGLILGRGVAGTFFSWEGTFADFLHDAWPAAIPFVVFCFLQCLISRRLPETAAARGYGGLLPAVVLIVLAVVWLVMLGPWK